MAYNTATTNVNLLRMERVYHKVVERATHIWDTEDNVDRYPKMRGLMEDLDRNDLELLCEHQREAILENDRLLIEAGVYKEKDLRTENINNFKKWNHNCVRLGRLFSMRKFIVTHEEKKVLIDSIVKDSIFLNPIVSKRILA